MKLRNKKTGEKKAFGNLQVYAEAENTNESQFLGNFDSFKQILEYYEDYIPKEPLIKDPKIRKAVRAWAEANGVTSIVVFDCNNGACLKINEMEFAENGGRASISFNTNEKIDTSKAYTIEELCGEEEE